MTPGGYRYAAASDPSRDVAIRPMRPTDLPALVASAQVAIGDMQRRLGAAAPPEPTADRSRPEPDRDPLPDPDRNPTRPDRAGRPEGSPILRQLLELDAGGAWVAMTGDEVVGGAVAGLRERLWYLAHFHVRPSYQGLGIGRALLTRSLEHGEAASGRMLHSSLDPQAMRSYHRAGFALGPAFRAVGQLRRDALPAVPTIRIGDAADLSLAADIDRRQRGAAHGADLEILVRLGGRLLVVDQPASRGYALVGDGPQIVAATDEPTARSLLWAALAESGDGDVTVPLIHGDQQWAIDVVVRAGLDLRPTGPLCRAGDTGPMSAYLPHTGLL